MESAAGCHASLLQPLVIDCRNLTRIQNPIVNAHIVDDTIKGSGTGTFIADDDIVCTVVRTRADTIGIDFRIRRGR